MNHLQEQKLNTLFQFYVENGGEQTIEEIAAGIGVTPKTIFNRYHSREEMELVLQAFWRKKLVANFRRKLDFCNNTVEKLLFFVTEVLASSHKTTCFFEKELSLRTDFSSDPDAVFADAVKSVIVDDHQHAALLNVIDADSYAKYFVYFVFNVLAKEKSLQLVDYLLKSVLSEEGLSIYSDIDLERLLRD